MNNIAITSVIAVCAIVSPILTSIINNHYQLKIRKIEASQKLFEDTVIYKRNVFECYLKHAGRCIARSDASTLKDYGEYHLIAFMYATEDIQKSMSVIHTKMLEYQWQSASKDFEQLIPKINEFLNDLRHQCI
ncbi:hypothetical protein ACTQ6A_13765 [Lachnospiraceae bacterium LCP25S3_G4]